MSAPLLLHVELARGHQAGDRFAFRWGESEYIRIRGEDQVEDAGIAWTPALAADLEIWQRGRLDPGARSRLGLALRGLLLDAGWAHEEAQIKAAVAEHREVIVEMRLHAAELFALPWEALPLGEDGPALGLVPGVLLRYGLPGAVTAARAVEPPPEGGGILYAWCASGGAVPAGPHARALAEASREHLDWDARTWTVAECSLGSIAEALGRARDQGRPIAILHLLAHGAALPDGSAGLALRDDGLGLDVVVSGAQLAAALRPFLGTLRVVVLCACHGGAPGPLGSTASGVALALHEAGLEAVVASRLPLSIAGSVALTETLYAELIQRPDSLERAFEAAQHRVLQGPHPADGYSVQLYAQRADGRDTRPIVFRPYRGLLPFRRVDQRLFFGRERAVQEVVHKLDALVATPGLPDIVFLVGPSGVGKSSLLAAGVLPALEARWPGLRIGSMRPGADPVAALQAAVVGLDALPALLLVDQLEELFTQCEEPSVRAAFAAALWATLQRGVRCLATLRGDHLDRLGEIPLPDGRRLDAIAYDEAHRVFVGRMSPDELRAAIVGPAALHGLELDPGLCEHILEEIGMEPGALPLVQHALDQLWRRREGRRLTSRAYEVEIGGIDGALSRHADGVLEALPTPDRALARRLLPELVHWSGAAALATRRTREIPALAADLGLDAAALDRVISPLVDARLLVRDQGPKGAPRLEIAHEALIRRWPTLQGWLAEGAEARAAREWLAGLADERKREPGFVLTGAQLVAAVEFRDLFAPHLPPHLLAFIHASETAAADKAARAQRIRRLTIAGSLTLAAVLTGLTLWANAERVSANDTMMAFASRDRSEDPHTDLLLLREVARPDEQAGWVQLVMDAMTGDLPPSWVIRPEPGVGEGVARLVVRGLMDRVAGLDLPDGAERAWLGLGREAGSDVAERLLGLVAPEQHGQTWVAWGANTLYWWTMDAPDRFRSTVLVGPIISNVRLRPDGVAALIQTSDEGLTYVALTDEAPRLMLRGLEGCRPERASQLGFLDDGAGVWARCGESPRLLVWRSPEREPEVVGSVLLSEPTADATGDTEARARAPLAMTEDGRTVVTTRAADELTLSSVSRLVADDRIQTAAPIRWVDLRADGRAALVWTEDDRVSYWSWSADQPPSLIWSDGVAPGELLIDELSLSEARERPRVAWARAVADVVTSSSAGAWLRAADGQGRALAVLGEAVGQSRDDICERFEIYQSPGEGAERYVSCRAVANTLTTSRTHDTLVVERWSERFHETGEAIPARDSLVLEAQRGGVGLQIESAITSSGVLTRLSCGVGQEAVAFAAGGADPSAGVALVCEADAHAELRLWPSLAALADDPLGLATWGVHRLAFTRDGARLIGSLADGTMVAWSVPDGRERFRAAAPAAAPAEGGRSDILELSPVADLVLVLRRQDGGRVEAATFSTLSGEPAGRHGCSSPTANATSAAFDADGRGVLVGCDDGTVSAWPADGGGAIVSRGGTGAIVDLARAPGAGDVFAIDEDPAGGLLRWSDARAGAAPRRELVRAFGSLAAVDDAVVASPASSSDDPFAASRDGDWAPLAGRIAARSLVTGMPVTTFRHLDPDGDSTDAPPVNPVWLLPAVGPHVGDGQTFAPPWAAPVQAAPLRILTSQDARVVVTVEPGQITVRHCARFDGWGCVPFASLESPILDPERIALSPDGRHLAIPRGATVQILPLDIDTMMDTLWRIPDCLPAAARVELLGESRVPAVQRAASCRDRVGR